MGTEMTEEVMLIVETTEQETMAVTLEELTELEDIFLEESTELEDIFLEEPTESVMVVSVDDTASVELLMQIAADVRIIVLFTIITFCSACMRGWRNVVGRMKG